MHEAAALPVSRRAEAEGAVRPLEGLGLRVERAGRVLLDIPELRMSGSEITALMGFNGSGKSLLLRVLAGLVQPDAGTVLWAGRPPGRERARRLGFVFQKPVLLRRSAAANIRYALKVAGFPRAEIAGRTEAALASAGLQGLAGSPARVLSGGEQQRLAVARALALEPEVLFLDEPTASLDPGSTLAIEALVAGARGRGTKIVLVTHDAGQARRLAQEILFLQQGRLVERASAGQFFTGPQSEAARAFLEGRIHI
ncbi:ATP-binding cassette domain-containing protein [Propylenella binzhouense]|uniref:ATP-binding cassette domain-containing protein n=1 Tax=Propylenella binzhouense TaxID=2555902 RepID=A0A964T809_9HYPH|nr:ATP-binding cassette domain-containing protein [Propylenella binzhouense]MYZ49047.1 ATP-binding cassette domain-containing protein [Propylenella binzhouense]